MGHTVSRRYAAGCYACRGATRRGARGWSDFSSRSSRPQPRCFDPVKNKWTPPPELVSSSPRLAQNTHMRFALLLSALCWTAGLVLPSAPCSSVASSRSASQFISSEQPTLATAQRPSLHTHLGCFARVGPDARTPFELPSRLFGRVLAQWPTTSRPRPPSTTPKPARGSRALLTSTACRRHTRRCRTSRG